MGQNPICPLVLDSSENEGGEENYGQGGCLGLSFCWQSAKSTEERGAQDREKPLLYLALCHPVQGVAQPISESVDWLNE